MLPPPAVLLRTAAARGEDERDGCGQRAADQELERRQRRRSNRGEGS